MTTEKAPAAPAAAAPELRTIEAWAKAKNTPDWLFAGAKAGNRWAVGKLLTEAAYDAAIHAAASVTLR